MTRPAVGGAVGPREPRALTPRYAASHARPAMRVLFTTIRNTSHFLPLVPFIEACRRRGDEVAVAAPIDLEARVAKTGAAFFPFGHPGDAGLRPIWDRLRDAPSKNHMTVREIFAGACATAALPGLLETLERFAPAVVVRESQEYAAVVAAEKSGVPHARVSITARGIELEMLDSAIENVDVLGRSAGLAPDPDGARMRGETALTLFPASVGGAESSDARILRFRAAPAAPKPLPAWWEDASAPLVYATFGTVLGSMDGLRATYRMALDALATLPVRALLTVGDAFPLEALGAIPPNVHVERFVPQDDVLPHAAAVLCHGGSGTVLGALGAGVPVVVAPMFADQPANAARVAAVGAGIALPERAESADEVRAAIARVLGEPSFRVAARAVADEMAALPPVDEAPRALERLAR